MTELATYQPQTALSEQMDYARAVSDGSLLPDTYRGKPANVLIAVGLGSAMGLSPAESLYRIDVIQGKPTASAELIAANVRKAGHKLRVRGDDNACTATIIRADDPDFEFTVTRDVAWAQAMGLTNKDNYKKQRGTMLQWRAITAVARLACPEALYGVAYTPDEMYDDRPAQTTAAQVQADAPAADRMRGILGTPEPQPAEDVIDVEPEPDQPEPQQPSDPITPAQLKKLQALLREVGLNDRDEALAYYQRVVMHPVDSSKSLSKSEAGQVIDDLERAKTGEPNLLDGAA